MKFERLRLAGFKTFVDPTDLMIAPGLTGIVGPNGCGKSNLVEALRWVMGETSSKSLRGGGMEDVIFAGSGTRPERNHAEVSIRIGEPPADLPGHLHGADQLDISRKIAREQGSTYRINGREVRARDVQILFADAASGARSPSLVRQGQIGEIIAAKPQHRRRILEDAAGIAGLHARRHEAELRLKQAEENLHRAEDVLTQLDRQIGDLKRQARQSERYKAISAEIRLLDLALHAATLKTAQAEEASSKAAHDLAIRQVAAALVTQGEAERERAVAEHGLASARTAASDAQDVWQGLLIKRETLDSELKQAESRLDELAKRRVEMTRDLAHARQIGEDAAAAMAALTAEQADLTTRLEASSSERNTAGQALHAAQSEREKAEAALIALRSLDAQAQAEYRASEQQAREARGRADRLAQNARQAQTELEAAQKADPALATQAQFQAKLDEAMTALEEAQKAADTAEAATRLARQEEQALRPRLAEAERLVQRLETEARTIRKLVENTEPGLFTRAIDQIKAEAGFETALAAALGDDLEAALEISAPRFWSDWEDDQPSPALPDGVEVLARHVEAPKSLARRLKQIGVVGRANGPELQKALKQGQRLVSREGDLWRWDGFTRKAEAPSAAAKRLAERNRLAALEAEAETAARKRDEVRSAMDKAIRALKSAGDAESQARERARRLGQERERLAAEVQREMRRTQEARLRVEALSLRVSTLMSDQQEAEQRALAHQQAFEALPPPASNQSHLAALSGALDAARQAENAARSRFSAQEASLHAAQTRLVVIGPEQATWQARQARAADQIAEYDARLAALDGEAHALSERPALLQAERRALASNIDAAENVKRAAADRLAEAETQTRKADDAARTAFQALSTAREYTARLEAQREHTQARLLHLTQAIEAEIDAPAAQLENLLPADGPQSGLDAPALEARLADLKADRERLGAVNLRADLELNDVEGQRGDLAREREELTEAIRRFRRAIDALNAEGRSRLRAAFDGVNAQFTRLFERLFGGGTAELKLVEADDPLEAGLEILAHPPGKKPQLLSLLSGGEQALTATALIFAVFLTNPSPICVLDEVDAPLDDSNVERLCDLLHDMARDTATRFLVITHNPISMARMDRLYGVTMVERGVSQLVSVDLNEAEKLAEAV